MSEFPAEDDLLQGLLVLLVYDATTPVLSVSTSVCIVTGASRPLM